MGTEIERKFLVVGDAWREAAHKATAIRQGYLVTDDAKRIAVRVRIKGDAANLNIKAVRGEDLAVRDEYEYPIPLGDAQTMLDTLCTGTRIDKVRYEVWVDGLLWEVDAFEGANAGLVVAEVELTDRDQAFAPPSWLGEEVTGDPRYLNQRLAEIPYTRW